MRQTLIFASLVLAVPAFAAAQGHGGRVGGGEVAVAAPHAAAPVATPHAVAGHPAAVGHVGPGQVGVHHVVHASATATPVHRINIASGLRNLPLFSFSDSNVPGLGFDYAHLAAVNSGSGPGFDRRRFLNQGAPFGFGGFLLGSPGYYADQPVVEGQPPVEEEAAANTGAADNDRDVSDQFLPSAPQPAAPQPDAAEYVFVRRDGSLVFAVAYFWDNGTLRYVTRDGMRRSLTQDSLDLDATQQFNEQRGLTFRAPTPAA